MFLYWISDSRQRFPLVLHALTWHLPTNISHSLSSCWLSEYFRNPLVLNLEWHNLLHLLAPVLPSGVEQNKCVLFFHMAALHVFEDDAHGQADLCIVFQLKYLQFLWLFPLIHLCHFSAPVTQSSSIPVNHSQLCKPVCSMGYPNRFMSLDSLKWNMPSILRYIFLCNIKKQASFCQWTLLWCHM